MTGSLVEPRRAPRPRGYARCGGLGGRQPSPVGAVARLPAMSLRLDEVTALLDRWYDPAWAEDWDAVGLVCGDPEQPVRRILLAVDPAPAVVAEAVEWGADLVVCHHPLLLTPVHGVAASTPKGRIVHDLVRAGTALFTAHTNADVPADGVNEALARAVGIVDPRVVVSTEADAGDPGDAGDTALDKLVTFVPE